VNVEVDGAILALCGGLCHAYSMRTLYMDASGLLAKRWVVMGFEKVCVFYEVKNTCIIVKLA